MSDEKTVGQTFTIKGQTLDDYFADKNRHTKITRGEMAELMLLLVDKHTLAQAFEAMRFHLRQTVKEEVQSEMGEFMLSLQQPPEEESLIIKPDISVVP